MNQKQLEDYLWGAANILPHIAQDCPLSQKIVFPLWRKYFWPLYTESQITNL